MIQPEWRDRGIPELANVPASEPNLAEGHIPSTPKQGQIVIGILLMMLGAWLMFSWLHPSDH